MGENSKEVNLDVGLKTISNILGEVSKIDGSAQKAERLDFYVHLMEEEMKKIDAFKRELPHCMYLLIDAIETLKEESLQLKGKKMGLVTEEFILLKNDSEGNKGVKGSNDISDKKSWMSSVNLWSTPVQYENNFCTPNQDSLLQLGPIRYQEEEGSGSASHLNGCNFKNKGGAFVPYKKPFVMEKEERILPADGLSLSIPAAEIESDDSTVKEDCGVAKFKMQQPHHKRQRRCWSPELHKRFVDALEQLGGAQSATPKQIRDFMKVDGLTNDEVKSHLQKFRLHVRKTPTSSASLVDYSTFAQSGCSKMSRPMVAHSGSPPGPFPRGGGANKGGSTSGGGSMEDEEDDKSGSQNWKGRLLKNIERRL